MGGRVGLKGSDGPAILHKARELGALPESPRRTVEALRAVSRIKDDIELITCPYEMGEYESRECGFAPTVIGSIAAAGPTTAEDTIAAAREMGVKLVRSAYSPIVREANDCSAALLDPQGYVVSQAELIPMQLGPIGTTFSPCAELFPPETLEEGDFYINNDRTPVP